MSWGFAFVFESTPDIRQDKELDVRKSVILTKKITVLKIKRCEIRRRISEFYGNIDPLSLYRAEINNADD